MISKEQFGEWKQHPATKFFWKLLADRHAWLASHVMEGWIQGTAEFDKENKISRGRILELLDICEITHKDIVDFYKEMDSATEITEDDSR